MYIMSGLSQCLPTFRERYGFIVIIIRLLTVVLFKERYIFLVC